MQAGGVPDEGLLAINRLWTIARVFTNTAHQINNALQVIAGNAELLEARDIDPAVRRRVETIRAETGRAAGMLNQLLEYVRGGPAAPQTHDLAALVEAVVAMRVASTSRRRIALTVERSDSNPFLVHVDRLRATQLLVNVLLASEAWLPEVGGSVSLRMARHSGSVRLTVAANSADGSPPTGAGGDSFSIAVTTGAEEWAAVTLAADEHVDLSATSSGRSRLYTMTFSEAR
jgi:signal transduction histidine kinase